MKILCDQVYRVNWLRGKARYERWREEHITVRDEMGNTIRWYEWMKKEWERREKDSMAAGHIGHASYAAKKANMWQKLANHARKQFGNDAV
jgi:hypothetical protein